jgi:UDP-N-acetylglucosamine acyltransferase
LRQRAILERNVNSRCGVKVGVGTVLGGDPQDLKYKGEHTTVEIGDGTTIANTRHQSRTTQSYKTTVGKGCFLMSYVHLRARLSRRRRRHHLEWDATRRSRHHREKAILSGLVAVHQFATIGRYSFIGGCSRVAKDVPPYVKAVGNPIKLYGLNTVGLERNGFPEEVRRELKRAYRLFFKSELNLSQARERAVAELQQFPEISEFLAFFDRSDRGSVV